MGGGGAPEPEEVDVEIAPPCPGRGGGGGEPEEVDVELAPPCPGRGGGGGGPKGGFDAELAPPLPGRGGGGADIAEAAPDEGILLYAFFFKRQNKTKHRDGPQGAPGRQTTFPVSKRRDGKGRWQNVAAPLVFLHSRRRPRSRFLPRLSSLRDPGGNAGPRSLRRQIPQRLHLGISARMVSVCRRPGDSVASEGQRRVQSIQGREPPADQRLAGKRMVSLSKRRTRTPRRPRTKSRRTRLVSMVLSLLVGSSDSRVGRGSNRTMALFRAARRSRQGSVRQRRLVVFSERAASPASVGSQPVPMSPLESSGCFDSRGAWLVSVDCFCWFYCFCFCWFCCFCCAECLSTA